MSLQIPESNILSLRESFHVGDLSRPRGLRKCLYASAGLFVSLHPEEWSAIARRGGYPTWVVRRRDGSPSRFLDWLNSDVTFRSVLADRVVDAGLATRTTHYQVEYYDDEREDTFSFTFSDRERAQYEADAFDEVVKEVPGFAPTEALLERWLATFDPAYKLDGKLVLDFAIEVLLERETDLDGIWWDETLDVSRLSAPQGVIFEARLPDFVWKITDQMPDQEVYG